MPLRSSGVVIGRLLLVIWRMPLSIHERRIRFFGSSFFASSSPIGPSSSSHAFCWLEKMYGRPSAESSGNTDETGPASSCSCPACRCARRTASSGHRRASCAGNLDSHPSAALLADEIGELHCGHRPRIGQPRRGLGQLDRGLSEYADCAAQSVPAARVTANHLNRVFMSAPPVVSGAAGKTEN